MEKKQIYNNTISSYYDLPYLMHHGIRGQKWGVRRFQNPDGSLTDAGKKRVKAAYNKTAEEHAKYIAETEGRRTLTAYNNAADRMNNGLIDKYNSDYDKKHGIKNPDKHNYDEDPSYDEGMSKLFNKVYSEEYNKVLYRDTMNSRAYQEGKKLIKEYKMADWDDVVAKDEQIERDLERKYGNH